MPAIKISGATTEPLGEIQAKLTALIDGAEAGEFDPEEIVSRSAAITEAAEEWTSWIKARLSQ